jgi:hypothetical protein
VAAGEGHHSQPGGGTGHDRGAEGHESRAVT